MSDDKQPELTPEQQAIEVTEQQTDDSAQIETIFGATDAYQRVTAMMDDIGFGSRGSLFGKTSFEGADLNAMLDLLDQSNPSDLENAGRELGKARDALNAAAQELDDYVKSVEWEGESGKEFRRYGTELAKYAWGLGTFANKVSTQMEVASTGLTSVRNAKPPRDGRIVRKKAEDFALPERRADNPEYAEAVKVEENRQEAINQMNRLASFYAVSEESLAAQEPPSMPKTLQADVPRPSGHTRDAASGVGASGAEASGTVAQQPDRHQVQEHGTAGVAGPGALGKSPVAPDWNTSMEIDSVTAPPAPPAASPAPSTPTATGGPGTPTGPVGPMVPSFGGPGQNNMVRATGTSGVPRAGGGSGGSAVGRPPAGGSGTPTGRAGAAGRTGVFGAAPAASGNQGVAGRASGPMGTGSASGRAGVTGGSGHGAVAGRQGAVGQSGMGRNAHAPSPGARAGRADGIVGGTPQRSTAGSSGARIPRGNVIGAEGTGAGRASAARPTQSGVIGAPGNAPQRSVSKGTLGTNGVVGTPRNDSQAGRPSNGAPRGGAGQRQAGDEERDRRRARPDYLTEDDETWTTRRRGAVPPVID
ncbi:hypothetical protein ABZ557_21750 [Streptomyces sp. NPDC019645]|uniref:hypothetical protein n=1 Tax=Streptomyces sp. NPDC019645 TaxID=3154786 RepID=UPI0033EF3954